MHHSSVSWHKIHLQFSSWKIICFIQKEPIKKIILQTFECSNESPPNSPCHFWNKKIRIYLNFASLFSVMKDKSSVFLSSNVIYSEQKESSKVNFLDFSMVGWKFTKILMSYLKLQVIFHHSLVSCVITVLYFFSWNFIWFKQNESIKMQNFRLSTARVKFH